MTDINQTVPAQCLATAQDYAAQSFGPATDRPFDEKAWRDKAANNMTAERHVIAVMRMDDKELFAKVAESEESADLFLEMHDMCGNLLEYYKDAIEVTQSARMRLLCVLSRLELRFEREAHHD